MPAVIEVTAPKEEIIRDYRAALHWLRDERGIRIDVGRLRTYADICDRLERDTFERANDKINFIDITAVIEVWRHRDQLAILPDFEQRLAHIAGGRQFYSDDADRTSRNFLFELACGCFLLDWGFPLVASPAGDLTVTKHGQTLLVECKRPSSAKSLARRCKEASQQIETRRHGVETGLIFFDLTLLANPALCFWEASSREESVRMMDAEINRLKVVIHPITAGVLRSRLDAGVVAHLVLPYWIQGSNEWVIQERTLLLGNPRASSNAKVLFDVLELAVERLVLGAHGLEWH